MRGIATRAGGRRPRWQPRLDAGVQATFMRRQLHIGLGAWVVAAAGIGAYLLATPSAPHRSDIAVLIEGSVPTAAVGFWWIGLQMVRRSVRWQLSFYVLWSLVAMVITAVAAHLDGGAVSPITWVLVLPVVFSGLAYPPAAVTVLAAAADLAYTVLALSSPASAASEGVVGMVVAIIGFLVVVGAWNRHVQERRLVELATHDGLSGCLTYRAFQERLELEVTRALRYGRTLSLVMADVDNLKAINDTEGHRAGDEAIVALGTVLVATSRRLDDAGRLGGDEFGLLLPETDETAAAQLLARLEASVDVATHHHVSVSFGVATLRPGDTPAELCDRADRALYRAKGRLGARLRDRGGTGAS